MSWYIDDSYPYIEGLPEPIEVPIEPLSTLFMTHVEGEYPKYDYLPEPIDVMIEPYPVSFMTQAPNEYPKYEYIPEPVDVLLKPYPTGIMIMEPDEYPKYADLKSIDTGAFFGAGNLESITLPKSVTSIGIQTFRHTKLKEVTISSECKYYPTSFPDDCVIKFY